MRKARNKKFSLLMAIVFLFTIMVPLVGPAAAGTTYSGIDTFAVSKSSSERTVIAKLEVKLDPATVTGGVYDPVSHRATINLPTKLKIESVTAVDVDNASGAGTDATVTFPNFVSGANNYVTVDVTNPQTQKVQFNVVMQVKIPKNWTGVIDATIFKQRGSFVGAEGITLGRVGTGELSVTTGDVPVITETGGDIAPIYVRENVPDGFNNQDKVFKIKLPKGFVWDSFAVENITTGANLTGYVDEVDSDGDDYRSIVLDSTSVPDTLLPRNQADVIKITGEVKVIDKKAKFGDIEAAVSSDLTINPTTIVVAKFGDYLVDVEADSVEEVLAGRIGEEIGDIILTEQAPGALVDGRSITLTLPSNAKWSMDEADLNDIFDNEEGDVTLDDIYYVDSRTIKMIVNNSYDNDPAVIRLENMEVSLAADATGELAVKVAGSAGVEAEVVVADVKAPVTVTADTTDIKIGLQEQAIGDIVITEYKAEALMEDDLYLRLPSGIYWAETPTVKVDGDLEIGEVKIDLEDNYLVIPIEDESDDASTITISNVTVSTYRTLPEGKIEVKVGGPAVNETYYADLFQAWTVASDVVAENVTPAPAETKKVAVFTLNSTTYTVEGVEQTMDVAAFAENGRTYLPLRYAALALGVDESNILWDGTTQTVTLLKGDKAVQVKIGSKEMFVNGVTIMMDVEPMVKDGRVLLPFRWIATAFGASVDYNAEAQTVTMTLDQSQRN